MARGGCGDAQLTLIDDDYLVAGLSDAVMIDNTEEGLKSSSATDEPVKL